MTLAGGGDGSGDWAVDGLLRVTGGRLTLSKDSNLACGRACGRGEGKLGNRTNGAVEVSAGGPHQLPDSVEPRLVITGGAGECSAVVGV